MAHDVAGHIVVAFFGLKDVTRTGHHDHLGLVHGVLDLSMGGHQRIELAVSQMRGDDGVQGADAGTNGELAAVLDLLERKLGKQSERY